MAYLLDTNTLIQAKNDYYSFSICPGFWKWIGKQSEDHSVISIEPVLEEIKEGDDDLTEWAKTNSKFFKPLDEAVFAQISRVVDWVEAGEFRKEAKRDFLAKADPILIAYALAHPQTVLVTHERHIEGERKKVKIPTVCQALGVKCIRTFAMLNREKASFVLPTITAEDCF